MRVRMIEVLAMSAAVLLSSCATKNTTQLPGDSAAAAPRYAPPLPVWSANVTSMVAQTPLGVRRNPQASAMPGTNEMSQPQVYSDSDAQQAQIEAVRAYLIKNPPPSVRYDDLMARMMFFQTEANFDSDGEPNILRTFLR
jgi:hypothetical protein